MKTIITLLTLCFALNSNAATYLLLSQTNAFAKGITNEAKAYADTKAPLDSPALTGTPTINGQSMETQLTNKVDKTLTGLQTMVGPLSLTNTAGNGVTITSSVGSNAVSIAVSGPGSNIPLQLVPKGTNGPVAIGDTNNYAALIEFHQNITPLDLVMQNRVGTNGYVGPTLVSASSDGAFPYIEFLRARGTIASPTILTTGDYVGEVAYIAYNGTHYRVSSLIDGVTTSGGNGGALRFVLAANNGTFDQTKPFFTFDPNFGELVGSNIKHVLTSFGVQIQPTTTSGANCTFHAVRSAAANYAYSAYSPEVATVTGTKPHWGQGLYASDYGLTTWTYNNSANVIRTRIDTNGNFGIATPTPTSTLHIAGSMAQSVAVGGSFTLTDTNDVYFCNVTDQLIKLPTPVGCRGRRYEIWVVAPAGSAIITNDTAILNGAQTLTIPASNTVALCRSDGTNWYGTLTTKP